MEMLLKWAMENAPELVIGLFVTMILPTLFRWAKNNANSRDMENIANVADIVYNVVNQIARVTPTTNDDKMANALDVARKQFRAIISSKLQEEKLRAMLMAKHEKERVPTPADLTLAKAEGGTRTIAITGAK